MAMPVDFVRTYIENLDKELGGGIPKGHIVIVAGSPGTMKTSFTFSIIYNNMKRKGTKALYITIEQTRESLITEMDRLGLGDFSERNISVIDIAKLRVEYRVVEESRNWLKILMEHLQSKIGSEGYDFIVIDSITALSSIMEFDNPRQELFHFFGFLKSLGATTFLISEVSSDVTAYGVHHEDFLADGIIHLKFYDVGETDAQLRIKIAKMRCAKHYHGNLALIYKDGGGFMVTPVISE